MSREEIEKEYLRLAKRADARLRNLEKYETKGESIATKWAYADAMFDIKTWGGNKRFKTTPRNLSDEEILMKISDIERFLSKKTSSIKEIHEFENERVKTLNNRYNVDYSREEWSNFFKSNSFEKAIEKYGSDTVFTVFVKLRKQREEIQEDMEVVSKKFAPIEKQVAGELLENGWKL